MTTFKSSDRNHCNWCNQDLVVEHANRETGLGYSLVGAFILDKDTDRYVSGCTNCLEKRKQGVL